MSCSDQVFKDLTQCKLRLCDAMLSFPTLHLESISRQQVNYIIYSPLYTFHLSFLLYGLLNPAAEREPESALVLSSKLVHPQLCVHLDPGKFPASGLLMFLDGCILNVTQEC